MDFKKKLIIIILIGIVLIIIVAKKTNKKEDNNYLKYMDKVKDSLIWNESCATIYTDLKYNNKNSYDIYIPNNIEKGKSQPVMLFIHGGSWESGNKEDLDYLCKIFTKAGYITATMNYSFVNSNGTTTFNNILDEITECLSSIKEKGNELNINIDQAALYGYSAGGHLALLYSYSRISESPIPLKFVFTEAGPTDFHRDSWKKYDDSYVLSQMFKYTGKQFTISDIENGNAESTINSISPINYVTKNSIPSLVAYAESDEIVDPVQYEKLKKTYDKEKATYYMMEFKNASHALFTNVEKQNEFYARALEYADKYFK